MEEKKFTNEELTAMVSEQNIQIQRMQQHISMMQTTNLFKVIELSFKVLENKASFKPDTLNTCAEFIAKSLTEIINNGQAE